MSAEILTAPSPAASGVAVRHGTGLGDGLAEGKLFFSDRKRTPPSDGGGMPFRGAEAEAEAFRSACSAADGELRALREASPEAAEIFELHRMLLGEPEFTEGCARLIGAGVPAAEAAERTGDTMAAVFEAMEDEYFRARATDMREVGWRVARILRGGGDPLSLPEGSEAVILVCRELTPGDAARLDARRVAGVVCSDGSAASHASILLRAGNVPAILRVGELPGEWDGEWALLDADAGTLTVHPSDGEREAFRRRKQEENARKEAYERVRMRPAVTPDGKEIRVFANIGGKPGEAKTALASGAGGIGLLRSEFLFFGRAEPPGEEEQYEAYRRVLREADGREVVIRTLDIGADKTVPYLPGPRGENPALGLRGIRLCFAEPELFAVQLRAILRASREGRAAVMLPMIVSADEVRRARRLISEMAAEVGAGQNIPVGIMLETPAAAVMARELAAEADFFSVGTNDLCQYTFAADRQDPDLAPLTDGEEKLEPLFRLITHAADCLHAAGSGKWIGVCGELAADPALTPRFLACGVDELSVAPSAIAKIKSAVIGQNF